jgi:hypothetical protein
MHESITLKLHVCGTLEKDMVRIIRPLVTLEAGLATDRQGDITLGQLRARKWPITDESELAYLKDPKSVQAVWEYQQNRSVEYGFLLLEPFTVGEPKERWSRVLQQEVKCALDEGKLVTDPMIRLLRKLVLSGRYTELIGIYLLAVKQKEAPRASDTVYGPRSENADSGMSRASSKGTAGSTTATWTPASEDEFAVAIREIFFSGSSDEQDSQTAVSSSSSAAVSPEAAM